MIKVTVWNENVHEREVEEIKEIYPNGIHNVIKDFLDKDGEFVVRTATLEQEEHGLTDEVLNDTDVLIWWGHAYHDMVSDEVVQKVYNRVLAGMGLVALHSAHFAKIFRKLLGTACDLQWSHITRKEVIWTILKNHPIAKGIPEHFILENEELYSEPFGIPQPDELVFIGWFEGGYVFRSGCCYQRGNGKIFYFQPGHETFPIFYNETIQQIIKNATKWANSDIVENWNDGCPELHEHIIDF